MASRNYQYEHINLDRPSIRLVKLFKGYFSEEIRCEIILASLDEMEGVPYEAVSYTWGNTRFTSTILVDGYFGLNVTTNLELALRYLRHPSSDRILWIDAISIDQTNIKERGHQVLHMGEIYKFAEQVLIWLGEDSDSSGALMDCLMTLPTQSPARNINENHVPDEKMYRDSHPVEDRQINHNAELKIHTRALELLLRRPWFKRVWVLQEVANARRARVVCGYREVAAQKLATAVNILGISADSSSQAVLDIVPGISRRTSWWSRSRHLLTLLSNFQHSEATDARDKIYALINMSTDASDGRFEKIDYSMSLLNVILMTSRFISSSMQAVAERSPTLADNNLHHPNEDFRSLMSVKHELTKTIIAFFRMPDLLDQYSKHTQQSILDRMKKEEQSPQAAVFSKQFKEYIYSAIQDISHLDVRSYERMVKHLEICKIYIDDSEVEPSNSHPDRFSGPEPEPLYTALTAIFNYKPKVGKTVNHSVEMVRLYPHLSEDPKVVYISQFRTLEDNVNGYTQQLAKFESFTLHAAMETSITFTNPFRLRESCTSMTSLEKFVTGHMLSLDNDLKNMSEADIRTSWIRWSNFVDFFQSRVNFRNLTTMWNQINGPLFSGEELVFMKLYGSTFNSPSEVMQVDNSLIRVWREIYIALRTDLIDDHTDKIRKAIERLPNGSLVISSCTWTAADIDRWNEVGRKILDDVYIFCRVEI